MEKLCLTLIISLLFTLPGCESIPEPRVIFSGIAMTMPYQVAIRKELSEGEKITIEEKIDEIFQKTNQIYNKFNPDSEISSISRLEKETLYIPSPELLSLLKRTDAFVQLSGGLFDPTIETEVDSAKGWHTLQWKGDTILKSHTETKLDLGGIAKGTTIDALLQEMNNLGYESVLVEWGGDFAFSTKGKEEAPWRIALYGQDEVLELWEGGLATSGDYHQFWKEGDKTLFHLYHPLGNRYLEQKEGHVTSVSVLAPTAEEADAYATILLLLETEEAGTAFLPSHLKAWWTVRE